MHLLLPLLLVAVGADVPLAGRYPRAAEVFHCTFDSQWDNHYDGWPAGWTRRSGPGYPQYVGIKIRREPAPGSNACLRVELNGGGATAYSPPIRINPLLSYVLEAAVRTEDLRHDRVWLSITLLDQNHRKLGSVCSERLAASGGWKKLRLGPTGVAAEAKLAVLGLHLEPQGDDEDLRGAASFADVWLGCLPRLAISSNRPTGVLGESQTVEITCTASGYLEPGAAVRFQLQDRTGHPLATARRPLAASSARGQPTGCWIGQARWEPPLAGPGFYRVRAILAGEANSSGTETITGGEQLSLAVVAPHPLSPQNEFGWTLPHGCQPHGETWLIDLLAQAGIRRVKYPLWCGRPSSGEALARSAALRDALDAEGIELVGLLCNPPQPAAELLAPDAKTWYPSLEPLMFRVASQVRWWQLGTDSDTSFADCAKFVAKVAEVKAALDQIGQGVHVGMGWNWREPLPAAARRPWDFLALSARPAWTADELAAELDRTAKSGLARWVVLEALPKQGHTPESRAQDLVMRMMAAKIHGAEGIFCPDPFDPECGLLEPDGTPGELLLPWRTTAAMLGGTRRLGSLELFGGSPNAVFSHGRDAVMVIWSAGGQEETVYLGPDIRQVDLWGHSVTPAGNGNAGRVIRADHLPSFVVGLSEPLVRWQMAFAWQQGRIPSIPGRRAANSFLIKNTFDQPVEVKVRLTAPEGWLVEPSEMKLRLGAAAESRQALAITLPRDALSGCQTVHADFEVRAERLYRFRLDRRLEVGMGDLTLDGLVRLSPQGELEVRQTLANKGKRPVSLRCELLVPDRRREACQIIDLRGSPDVKTYRLPNGRELLGKTLWLRAEEVDGERVLNCKLTAAQ